MFRQFIILILLSAALGLVSNSINSDGIDLVGNYRELSSGDGPVVPPEAEAGDPPFIDISLAQMEFANSGVLFVDAREEEEFLCGTIPGSVSLPFDYLPEENLGEHVDSVLNRVALDHPIIIFCSGEECDLSLHLARNLQYLNYTKVSIFFGGAREWEENGLDMERRSKCEE